jgi:hypothetical protein
VLKITNKDTCFGRCDADPRCAAACLTQPDQCRLFKYGFERADEISGSTAYIKPEVVDALASASQLSDRFPGLMPNTKLVNHYDAFDTLTPFKCFSTCKGIPSCDAASFTTENSQPFSCFLFKKNQYTVSEERDGVNLWTSYTKVTAADSQSRSVTSTKKAAKTKKTVIEENVKISGIAERKYVMANTRVLSHYDKLTTGSAEECFNKCDNEKNKCATACFTEPNLCHLAKFGFDGDSKVSSTLYMKPEVKDELTGFKKLGEKFHVVKHNTKLVGSSYETFDSLTPSKCFSECLNSESCAAASFNTDTVLFFNCFVFRAGKFTEESTGLGAEYFTSYVKES